MLTMLLFLVFLWSGAEPGQCQLPTQGWPEQIGLLQLVEFASTPLPCSQLIDAGRNQSRFLGKRLFLQGQWLDTPPEPHTLRWQQIAGPETTISSPNSLETWFEPTEPGTYRFEIQIAGDGWIALDQVTLLATQSGTVITGVEARLISTALELPVQITTAPGEPDQLYVVEQRGKIRILEQDRLSDDIFLDLDPDPKNPVLWDCFECGMLGLTFDPDYQENGLFYVSFTGSVTPDEDPETWHQQEVTRIFVYREQEEGSGKAFQRKLLLSIPQPFRNHHGGQMAFGPDGMFYISLGDSSPCGDPDNHAQDMTLLLGKVLRLKTNGFAPLSVPVDNPFVGLPEIRPEIWASGFRNPWRWSFDPVTGDVFWGDVGQNDWEEINWQPFGSAGENYGWRVKEGFECFIPNAICGDQPDCPKPGLTDPVFAYAHSTTRCAVIGGFVYRSTPFQHLEGVYFFGDFCNRNLMSLRQENGNWVFQELVLATGGTSLSGGLLTLGTNHHGDIYFATQNQLFRVTMVQAN